MRTADDRREALARGHEAEARVAAFLIAEGWTICARNWRGRGGELDIVAKRAGCLRFVEVKQRQPDDPVGLEAIGSSKQAKLVRAAQQYLNTRAVDFDEVAFMVAWVEAAGTAWRVELIDDAFDMA